MAEEKQRSQRHPASDVSSCRQACQPYGHHKYCWKQKGPRCILVHRGPLGHALMVEAGGVEPPSEKDSREASTGLGWVSYLASGLAPNQGARRYRSRGNSRQAPSSTSLMRCRQPDVSGVGPSDVTINVVRCLAVFRQRKRSRNRCWQLLLCRFLRGQRRLDLQLWFPHPRRNQCAPNWEVLL